MIGANKKIIDAQVAKKKEEYVNNEKLADVFKLYKSKKVISIPVNKPDLSCSFIYSGKLLPCICFIQNKR